MNSLAKVATSAVVALSIGLTALSTTAHAGKRERDVVLGVTGGIIAGAIIANEINRPRVYSEPPVRVYRRAPDIYVEPRHVRRYREVEYRRPRLSDWELHVLRCEEAYRSYDRRTDTFIDYNGVERECRL